MCWDPILTWTSRVPLDSRSSQGRLSRVAVGLVQQNQEFSIVLHTGGKGWEGWNHRLADLTRGRHRRTILNCVFVGAKGCATP
jgi:hypothetical protein